MKYLIIDPQNYQKPLFKTFCNPQGIIIIKT